MSDVAIEREEMEVDVLIVGGGSSGLSAAYQLQSSINEHNEQVAAGKKEGEEIPEQMIVVIEKGAEVGAHSFSGAVLDKQALKEMIPDYQLKNCPLEAEVHKDAVYYLGKGYKVKFPITPPPFQNEGNHIISLSKFNRWLGEQCEEMGVNIFLDFLQWKRFTKVTNLLECALEIVVSIKMESRKQILSRV